MSNKVYVGNLNYRTSEADLSELFTQYGSVASARIITDRATGRSKGFGFVEMESEEAAAAAISSLNGQEFQSRELRVSEAIEKAPR
ncbi:MAG: RNA-binding protein [Spirochaetales bacterium]|nr:RNA-binding protein [Spirochaetales bacterium]